MLHNGLCIPGFQKKSLLHQGTDSDREFSCPSLDAFLGLLVAMLVRDYSQAIE